MQKETDLKKLEDVKVLDRLAKQASKQALREAKALALPVRYLRGHSIVEKDASGHITEIKKIKGVRSTTSLKKGSKLCLK